MSPTLVSACGPIRNVHPADPIYRHNWTISLTEAVPDGAVLRIGEPPYSEAAVVERCTGAGPYVVELGQRLRRPHNAGTPVTVVGTPGD